METEERYLMGDISWLMAANIAVWLGIGGYVALLGRKQKALSRRLRQMEMLKND